MSSRDFINVNGCSEYVFSIVVNFGVLCRENRNLNAWRKKKKNSESEILVPGWAGLGVTLLRKDGG